MLRHIAKTPLQVNSINWKYVYSWCIFVLR